MRRAALILLALTGPTEAAASPCVFEDVGVPPLRFRDRLVIYQRRVLCPGPAQGEIRVEIRSALGKQTHVVSEKTRKVAGNGRWKNRIDLVEKGFPNHYCRLAEQALEAGKLPRWAAKKARLGQFGGVEAVVFPVPVTARLSGSGGLAGLEDRQGAEAWCRLCPRPKGTVGFYEGRAMARELGPKTRLRAELDGSFFRCAAPHSELEIRFFSAPEEAGLKHAMRPVLVLEGLKRRLRPRDDGTYGLEEAAPLRELCQKVPASERRHLAWELSGPGTLKAVGGGGRSRTSLRCP